MSLEQIFLMIINEHLYKDGIINEPTKDKIYMEICKIKNSKSENVQV
jgi:hypothetical protein